MLILIVEDDEDIRYSLKELLEMQGIKCILAKNADEGFGAIKKYQPDIIIVDFLLEGKTCIELVRAAKELIYKPYIVICSASNKAKAVADEYKVDGFLSKPFDIDNIQEIISHNYV